LAAIDPSDMNLYCSKKLETFMGHIKMASPTNESSALGDWNGHLFAIDRKKWLIFMNNKTCYSVILKNVLKKEVRDFGLVFKERLIRQLDHDLKITERQEIRLRTDLADVVLRKSNNDKKIIGTINHHVDNLKYNYYQAGRENWDEVRIAANLNDYLVGTKIAVDRRSQDYFRPIELMKELLK
jgi:hypothetical protein